MSFSSYFRYAHLHSFVVTVRTVAHAGSTGRSTAPIVSFNQKKGGKKERIGEQNVGQDLPTILHTPARPSVVLSPIQASSTAGQEWAVDSLSGTFEIHRSVNNGR